LQDEPGETNGADAESEAKDTIAPSDATLLQRTAIFRELAMLLAQSSPIQHCHIVEPVRRAALVLVSLLARQLVSSTGTPAIRAISAVGTVSLSHPPVYSPRRDNVSDSGFEADGSLFSMLLGRVEDAAAALRQRAIQSAAERTTRIQRLASAGAAVSAEISMATATGAETREDAQPKDAAAAASDDSLLQILDLLLLILPTRAAQEELPTERWLSALLALAHYSHGERYNGAYVGQYGRHTYTRAWSCDDTSDDDAHVAAQQKADVDASEGVRNGLAAAGRRRPAFCCCGACCP
jgi:hypothetical protein